MFTINLIINLNKKISQHHYGDHTQVKGGNTLKLKHNS